MGHGLNLWPGQSHQSSLVKINVHFHNMVDHVSHTVTTIVTGVNWGKQNTGSPPSQVKWAWEEKIYPQKNLYRGAEHYPELCEPLNECKLL